MDYGDKIFKLIQKCNRNSHKPDLHSFKADIKKGIAFVECRGFEINIETRVWDGKSERATEWTGTEIAASNRLEMLGIDLESIET